MGKRLTPKKRTFLESLKTGASIPDAAATAGYCGAHACYKFLRRDAGGAYLDPTVRAILGGPEPERPSPMRANASIATVLAFPSMPVSAEGITVEWCQRALWAIAEDREESAGPRVQAAHVLLKDLRDTELPAVQDSAAVIEQVKIRLGLIVAR